MNEITTVGCDLHDRDMLLKIAAGMSEPQQRSFGNDCEGREAMVQHLFDFARRHGSQRIVFVYEASGQGYGLHDLLTDQGVECYVLSPTHLAKSSKQKRNKTDAKDAQMLLERARAHVLAGNALPVVWTPPKALRNDRELVRARLETAEAGTTVKLQILSLLKRHGLALPKNHNWTKKFQRWLAGQAALLPAVVAAYLGLTPSADESGAAADRKGHITRQGPSRIRKVLCQAAWAAVRVDSAVRTAWERIRGDRVGRGKKAIVAVMRQLGIRMWHVALAAGVSSELVARPIPPPRWLAASPQAQAV
jgi:transposase